MIFRVVLLLSFFLLGQWGCSSPQTVKERKADQVLMAREGQLFTITLEGDREWQVSFSHPDGVILMGREKKESQILIFKTLKKGSFWIDFQSPSSSKTLKLIVN